MNGVEPVVVVVIDFGTFRRKKGGLEDGDHCHGRVEKGISLKIRTLLSFLSFSMLAMTTSFRGTAWFANRISMSFVACVGSRSFMMSFARDPSSIGVR